MEFKSKYKSMSFYSNGERKRFANGIYNTENAEEIKDLKKLKHVTYSESEDLEDKKVSELKEMAKDKGVEGYANMKKEELIEALKGE